MSTDSGAIDTIIPQYSSTTEPVTHSINTLTISEISDDPLEGAENAMSTPSIVIPVIPGIYGAGEGRKNLLIGGIRESSPNPLDPGNYDYTVIADNNDAIYIPTYYSGPAVNDLDNKAKTLMDSTQVAYASLSIPTYDNGLEDAALNGAKYNTIIAYSGGTVSSLIALDKQNVKCDTLILVSPMRGALSPGDYKNAIQRILNNHAVNNIVVLWSQKDTPFLGDIYQADHTLFGGDSRIKVYEAPLKQDGNAGHTELFFDYAKSTIKNGVYNDPQGQSTAYPKSNALQLSGSEFPDWMQSKKTSSGLEGWGGQPIGWGVKLNIYGGEGGDPNAGAPTYASYSSGGSGSTGTPQMPNIIWSPELEQQLLANVNEYNHYESTEPVYSPPAGS